MVPHSAVAVARFLALAEEIDVGDHGAAVRFLEVGVGEAHARQVGPGHNAEADAAEVLRQPRLTSSPSGPSARRAQGATLGPPPAGADGADLAVHVRLART